MDVMQANRPLCRLIKFSTEKPSQQPKNGCGSAFYWRNIMIDMKSTSKNTSQPICDSDQSEYPWGLSINLDNESIEKLGVNFSRLVIGQKVKLTCEAEVVGASEEKMKGGEGHRSVRLQITGMSKPVIKNRMAEGKDILKKMRS